MLAHLAVIPLDMRFGIARSKHETRHDRRQSESRERDDTRGEIPLPSGEIDMRKRGRERRTPRDKWDAPKEAEHRKLEVRVRSEREIDAAPQRASLARLEELNGAWMPAGAPSRILLRATMSHRRAPISTCDLAGATQDAPSRERFT